MFSSDDPHFAISYNSGIYQIITREFVLQMDAEKTIGFFLKSDSLLKNNLINSVEYQEDMTKVEMLMRSFLYQYSSAIRENKMQY